MSDVGTVYFLQVGEDGPIKIGFTKSDVVRRLRAMQQGSPFILRWIGGFSGTRQDELRTHKLLRHSGLRAEWFHPTGEVIAFVKLHAVGFSPISYDNETLVPHRKRKPVSELEAA